MKERPQGDGFPSSPGSAVSPDRKGVVSGPMEFDEWWVENQQEILRRARALYRTAADDCVQNTYVKLKEQSSTIVYRAIRSLVRREIHNQWVSQWRKDTREGKVNEDLEAVPEPEAGGMDPSQEAAQAIFREQVFRFLEDAPISDDDRRTFVARCFEGLSYPEIAAADGSDGESTPRMRVRKVMRMLREQLKAEGIEAASDLFDAE